jgi:hypothetical protein
MTKVVTGTYDEDGNRTVLAEAVKAFGELDVDRLRKEFEMVPPPREYVLLVHPLEGESVVDALQRHFYERAGTVTVATADGPRDVGVPLVLAGIKVLESSLVPSGEIRLAPRANLAAPIVALPLVLP